MLTHQAFSPTEMEKPPAIATDYLSGVARNRDRCFSGIGQWAPAKTNTNGAARHEQL
jgi:hypothetical protein